MSASMPGEAEFRCPPGHVTLQVGDLVQTDGSPAVVLFRNDCCAKVLRLAGTTKTFAKRFTGEVVEVTTRPQPERRCIYADRRTVIKHLSDEEMKDFLDHHAPRAVAGGKQTTTRAAQKGTEVMAVKRLKKSVVDKATDAKKGGSQVKPIVDKANTGPKVENGRNRGKLGTLFGASVVRVVMSAGKAGATYEAVQAVLAKHGVKAAEGTIKTNLRVGKSGVKEGPALTKEQLAEFGV